MRLIRRQSGNTLFLSVLVPLLLASILAGAILSLKRRTVSLGEELGHLVAQETARSAFVLMESAMQRRLWEVPPETRSGFTACMRRFDFSLSGVTRHGVSYTVQSHYEPQTKILSMESIATLQEGTPSEIRVVMRKLAKIFDVSDFLIYSTTPSPSLLTAPYHNPSPLSLIAGSRRIYFEGPVQFRVNRDNFYTSQFSDPKGIDLPQALGVVLQAERLYALGGLSYANVTLAMPEPNDPTLKSELAPYLANLFQAGGGGIFITPDEAEATAIRNWVWGVPGALRPLSDNAIKKQLLPRVYGTNGSSLPISAETLVDNGSFLSPNRWATFIYSYSANNFGARADFTCYEDLSVPPNIRKSCSNTLQYPKSFKAWRASAGLESTLLDSAETFDFPTLTWEHFDAFQEDAEACGLVIDSSSSYVHSYTDCDLSNKGVMDRYLADPSVSPCRTEYELDLNSLSAEMPNLDLNAYSDDTRKDEYLRRVIYSKVPLRIRQSTQALWPSNSQNTQRQNLPLWLVGEQQLAIVPYLPPDQDVASSDKGVTPIIPRLYFNADPEPDPSVAKAPLPLVVVNPELLVMESPTLVPYTYDEMKALYPVVNNKIVPKVGIMTDWAHQENDAYKYGVRQVHVSGMAILSSRGTTNPSTAFWQRGLWQGIASSAIQFVQNACLLDDPSDPGAHVAFSEAMPAVSGRGVYYPPYQCDQGETQPCSANPATNSRFYARASATEAARPDPSISTYNVPSVFKVQAASLKTFESIVEFEGLRIVVPFDSTVQAGRPRALGTAAEAYTNQISGNALDLGDRKITVPPGSYYYQSSATPYLCRDGIPLKSGTVDKISVLTNWGGHAFSQFDPGHLLDNLGSLVAVDLPVVTVSN